MHACTSYCSRFVEQIILNKKTIMETIENQNTNDQKNFTNHMAKALVTVLLGILYILKLPYDLWSQATLRLSEQGDKGIKISNFKGKWPMLSFMKFWLLEFGFDVSIFLCYIFIVN